MDMNRAGANYGKHSKPVGLTAFLILMALAGIAGWLTYAAVHHDVLNHALIAAIKRNDTRAALTLLNQGADANARDELTTSVSLWRQLLNRLRGKRPPPSTAPTALLVALRWKDKPDRNGHVAFPPENTALIRALLKHGALVNVRDDRDFTPLFFAILDTKNATIRLLIDAGAHVMPDHPGDEVPLTEAAANSQVSADVIKAMLDHGADVNVRDSIGHTALMWAVLTMRVDTVRVLLARHADVNLKYRGGRTALSLAAGGRIIPQMDEIYRMLKKAGAKE